ncbi:MAG: hypothetical protein P8Z81_11185 [Deinococcales bacterium]
MARSGLIILVALAAFGVARAATPIPYDTPHGVMVVQALHTLGAWVVPCTRLPGNVDADPGQVLCAQVPGSMYGFFREAVHGRLYEYLERKTLAVVHDWSGAHGALQVVYAVDGGTLTVTRERANGLIFAVFHFVPPATATAPVAQDAHGELSATAPATSPQDSANTASVAGP